MAREARSISLDPSIGFITPLLQYEKIGTAFIGGSFATAKRLLPTSDLDLFLVFFGKPSLRLCFDFKDWIEMSYINECNLSAVCNYVPGFGTKIIAHLQQAKVESFIEFEQTFEVRKSMIGNIVLFDDLEIFTNIDSCLEEQSKNPPYVFCVAQALSKFERLKKMLWSGNRSGADLARVEFNNYATMLIMELNGALPTYNVYEAVRLQNFDHYAAKFPLLSTSEAHVLQGAKDVLSMLATAVKEKGDVRLALAIEKEFC